MRDSVISLDILDGACAGYCKRVCPSPSVVEDSKTVGWPLMVEVESETPSGGAIRFVSSGLELVRCRRC